MSDETDARAEINYHLELTPAQLKITHTALRALLDDYGHEEAEVHAVIHQVLEKLPDEHAIRAIQLKPEAPADIGSPPSGDDNPPAAA
jgi:hypothetical protein